MIWGPQIIHPYMDFGFACPYLLETDYVFLEMAESSSRVGSFLMDFSAYPRLAGRNAWATARVSERVPGNHTAIPTGKFLPYPWQSSSENPPSDLFLQASACGMSIPASYGIPPPPSGECISVVADSSCALSLLSNQPWGSRNRPSSGLELHSLMNAQGAPVAEPTAAPHGGPVNHFPTTWGVKSDMAGSSSHQILPDLGLGQISQPLTSQFSGELELSQQSRRPFMEPGHTRDFDSSGQHMHWSL